LKYLNAADNKFKSLATFKNCPRLEELYLQNNVVGSMVGLDGVPALRVLNLRHNKVEKIDEELVPLEALEYLNLRTNKIPDIENLIRLF
jgi:Leucine-rich repeat (LRR) protein